MVQRKESNLNVEYRVRNCTWFVEHCWVVVYIPECSGAEMPNQISPYSSSIFELWNCQIQSNEKSWGELLSETGNQTKQSHLSRSYHWPFIRIWSVWVIPRMIDHPASRIRVMTWHLLQKLQLSCSKMSKSASLRKDPQETLSIHFNVKSIWHYWREGAQLKKCL